jgi:hypothetical protein
MAVVRNPQGAIVSIPDKDLARAKATGYTDVSPADVQDAKSKAAAAEHPWQAALVGVGHGALDAATAIPRAIGGLGEAIAGPNAVSETLGQVTPENVVRGLGALGQPSGPAPTAPYMQATPATLAQTNSTEQVLQNAQHLEQANPWAAGAGQLVGAVAGFEAGGLGALGSAAGGTFKGAGFVSRAANVAAEAAAIGGTTGVAQAAAEAHHNASYLTGQQALVGGSLGAILAGSLMVGGKVAGKFLEGRRPATVPDLETPNAQHVERVVRENPNIKLGWEEDITAHTPVSGVYARGRGEPRHELVPERAPQPPEAFEPTARAGVREDVTVRRPQQSDAELYKEWQDSRPVESEQGMGHRTPEGDVTVTRPQQSDAELYKEFRAEHPKLPENGMGLPAAPVDELSKPITEPDPALAGADDTAFVRRTRYARGARDVFEPEYASHDLPLGGRKGTAAEPEELRAALNGEALNSLRRTEKVAKLMEVVPEGAHPDWIRGMTEEQRDAVCEYIGVPKASEHTWQALEDAVAEREGYTPDNGKWFKEGPNTEYTPHDPLAAPGPPAAPQGPAYNPPNASAIGELTPEPYGKLAPDPNAPAPGTYNPNAGANPAAIGDLPEIPVPGLRNPPAPGSYQGPGLGGPTSPDVIGINPSDVGGAGSAPTKAQGQWQALLAASQKSLGRRLVGHAARMVLGGVAGGVMGGLPGIIAGGVLGEAVPVIGRGLFRLAKKGTTMTLDALDMAMRTGAKIPGDWSGAMQQQVAKYGQHYFYSTDTDAQRAYKDRYKGLQALDADNGALIRDRVANSFGDLAQSQRGALQATMDSAQTGVKYLLDKAPKSTPNPNSLTPMTDAQKPTRSEINEFSVVYDAVLHPSTVVRAIANGTVVSAQMQALRTVYPRWTQEQLVGPAAEKLQAMDAAGQSLLPSQRKVMDIVLGVNTGVDADAFVKKYGDTFAQALAAQNMAPQPSGQSGKGSKGGGRALRRPSTITSRMNTQTSTFLGIDK